jgi:drug/metabolite transporter (DMT)-like permease
LFGKPPPRTRAILLGLLVAFLWATSWVLIKIGLHDIPALTFAGMRYFLGFLCLLPLALRMMPKLGRISRLDWLQLAILGILWYAIAQGAQFLGLSLLPAVTVSMLLNMTPVLVAVLAIFLLGEQPSWMQWLGIFLNLAGVLLYFTPVIILGRQWIGVAIVIAGVGTNAISSILGRKLNRSGRLPALAVTVISMGIGSILLLVSGLLVQGFPKIPAQTWGIVGWLAVVNTALAFTLWNYSLQTLTAVESSLINSSMLIQIALLAWIFLGEEITQRGVIGLLLAFAGVVLVQVKFNQRSGT